MDVSELSSKLDSAVALIKKQEDDAMRATAAHREATDAMEKKYDALRIETQEKTAAFVTEHMELRQKAEATQKALEQRLAEVETAFNRSKREGNKETEEKHEYEEKFVDWMRKGQLSESFDKLRVSEAKFMEQKAMSVGTDSAGGYLVTPQVSSMVTTRIFETSPIRQLASVVTLSSDSVEFPLDNSEATSGGWVGELSSRPATGTASLGMKKIEAFEQYAYPIVSQKLLDDAAFNVEQWISNKISDILSRTENTSFVTGAGATKPRGFMTYSAWAVAGTYESGAIEQINSGSAGAFTSDGLIDIQNSLIEEYQANARFVMRRASFGAIMKLKTGSGEYLFNRALERNSGRAFDLLGSPVVFAADVAAIASNALALAYGDFGKAYQIVDRNGIRVLRDPYNTLGQVGYYSTKRVGGDVVNFEAIKILKLAA
jgi:HK97 family phage major capsid protein